jgi:hypothetical protein
MVKHLFQKMIFERKLYLSRGHSRISFDGEGKVSSGILDDDVFRLLELGVVLRVQDHPVGQGESLGGAFTCFHYHHREVSETIWTL